MSKVNGYKCDVCNRFCSNRKALNHFTRKFIWSDFMGESHNKIYDFDICKNCFERIVMEIKKEGAE